MKPSDSDLSLEQRWKKEVSTASEKVGSHTAGSWSTLPRSSNGSKMESAQTAASGSTSNDNDMVRPEKWPAASLHLKTNY